MGFHAKISSLAAPARIRSQAGDPFSDHYYLPQFWASSLAEAGLEVTPELALTLSYVYCAVDTISADFGTATCQTFEDLGSDGRARVKYSTPGIGAIARKLRWQPNVIQTAKAFWSTLAWQYLLRPAAYAELMYRPGLTGFVDQLVPRHPDRVREQRLPSGRVQFELSGEPGGPRIVTQDEMFVVRNTSTTGLNAISRTQYGAKALASGLALQTFTTNYFKHGVTASLLATHKGGDLEDQEEADLHASITRYMSGVENAGGLLLVPEDIDVKALGVSARDAELVGLKNLGGRDVARMFKMPPSWLAIEGAAGYGTQVQDAQNYKNRTQVPMAVEFEQAVQRDLILAADKYFVKFNLDYLTRGNLLERMQAYEVGIRSRVIRPSEARVKEDMSPDAALDKLSEGDNRPGTSGTGFPGGPSGPPSQVARSNRVAHRAMLIVQDQAVRCVRRERAAVEKLATKHASDVDGWQAGLRDFYTDHAGFVAETMRLPMTTARAYAAEHGSILEADGIVGMTDAWAREQAEILGCLALDEAA